MCPPPSPSTPRAAALLTAALLAAPSLFTAEAYDKAASEVPLIRRKVANALAAAGKVEGTHSYKRLRNILENYPRDELFQIGGDELLDIALGILHLHDRPRIKTFTRRDPFDRRKTRRWQVEPAQRFEVIR